MTTRGPGSRPDDLARLLSVLRDPTRLAILEMLLAAGDVGCTVSEFTAHFPISQPSISRHVGDLWELGVLERRREGQWVRYTVDVEALAAAGERLCALGRRLGARQEEPAEVAVEVTAEVTALRAEVDQLRSRIEALQDQHEEDLLWSQEASTYSHED